MTYLMTNDLKLLVDELRYKLTVAFNRIDKLELEIQEKVSYIDRLREELGISMKQSITNKEERKSNGKS